MWPFSTIRNLRREVHDKAKDAANWKQVAADSLDKHRADARQMADLRVALGVAEEALNNADKDREALKVQLREADVLISEQHKQLGDLRHANGVLRRVGEGLSTQLAEAMRNDKRDPKTGRFVKVQPYGLTCQDV